MRHTYTSHYFDGITQKVFRKHQHQESENIAEMILGCFEAGKSIPFFLLHHCSSRYKSCGRSTSPMGVPQSWGYPERDGWLVYFMENPSYKWDDDWLPINTLILRNLYIHLNSVEQAHDFEWWTLGGRLGWPSHHDREDCSWKLKASGWLVLTPYLMLVLWHPCDPLRSVAIRCGLVEFSVGWCWMMLVVRAESSEFRTMASAPCDFGKNSQAPPSPPERVTLKAWKHVTTSPGMWRACVFWGRKMGQNSRLRIFHSEQVPR